MIVLLLGPKRLSLIDYLTSLGDTVLSMEGKIDCLLIDEMNVDFIVSYGYRHIITEEVIKRLPNKIINLHISYLPWNRGADPNLWSFLEDTPKGVSIHLIDSGIDTGDILAQQEVDYDSSDTLTTSYNRLLDVVEKLFMENWPAIRAGRQKSRIQIGVGSYHKTYERIAYDHLLTKGWETPVTDLIGKAVKTESGKCNSEFGN